MALGTYTELQTSVANVMARAGDAVILAYLPDAIALVEASLNRKLRVSGMETSDVLTGTDGVFTLPTDFLAARTVVDGVYGFPLKLVTPEWASENYPTNTATIPGFYTIVGGTLTTYPATSGTITISYYQKIPALSDVNTTNWLLTDSPDVYLFHTLAEAYAFASNADAAIMWAQRGGAIVDELNRSDVSKRYSGIAARVKGPTP